MTRVQTSQYYYFFAAEELQLQGLNPLAVVSYHVCVCVGVCVCSLTSKLAVLVFSQQEPPGLSDQDRVVWSGRHVALYLSMH